MDMDLGVNIYGKTDGSYSGWTGGFASRFGKIQIVNMYVKHNLKDVLLLQEVIILSL